MRAYRKSYFKLRHHRLLTSAVKSAHKEQAGALRRYGPGKCVGLFDSELSGNLPRAEARRTVSSGDGGRTPICRWRLKYLQRPSASRKTALQFAAPSGTITAFQAVEVSSSLTRRSTQSDDHTGTE